MVRGKTSECTIVFPQRNEWRKEKPNHLHRSSECLLLLLLVYSILHTFLKKIGEDAAQRVVERNHIQFILQVKMILLSSTCNISLCLTNVSFKFFQVRLTRVRS